MGLGILGIGIGMDRFQVRIIEFQAVSIDKATR